MLEVTSLYCGYDKEMIIKNVSFVAKRKENLCIVGPNGSGKSTLLKSIKSDKYNTLPVYYLRNSGIRKILTYEKL